MAVMGRNNTLSAKIAESTWNRLGKAWKHGVRLGEETLTDLLIFDFLPLTSAYGAKILATSKRQDVRQSTDLKIRVRSGAQNAHIYPIQAKKLYQSEKWGTLGKYSYLKTKTGRSSQFQIDVLERYARQQRAIPFYLLFNHISADDAPNY